MRVSWPFGPWQSYEYTAIAARLYQQSSLTPAPGTKRRQLSVGGNRLKV
jgi:hypothetical protein